MSDVTLTQKIDAIDNLFASRGPELQLLDWEMTALKAVLADLRAQAILDPALGPEKMVERARRASAEEMRERAAKVADEHAAGFSRAPNVPAQVIGAVAEAELIAATIRALPVE